MMVTAVLVVITATITGGAALAEHLALGREGCWSIDQ